MGKTFVEIRGRGLWMRDSMLELWLRLLALHVEEDAAATHYKPIRDQWLLASKYHFGGCCPHGLDTAVTTTKGEAVTRQAIQSLLHTLERAPAKVDARTFNLLGFGSPTFVEADFEIWRLIEVSEVMLDLIDGKVGGKAGDGLPFPADGDGPRRREDYAERQR